MNKLTPQQIAYIKKIQRNRDGVNRVFLTMFLILALVGVYNWVKWGTPVPQHRIENGKILR